MRLLTAAVGLPALLAAAWAGGWWFDGVLAAAALGAAWEFRGLTANRETPTPLLPPLLLTPGVVAAAAAGGEVLLAAVAATPVVLLAWLLATPARTSLLRHYCFIQGGVLYVGLPLGLAALLRGQAQGLEWVLLALAVAFASDASAYAVGRAAGRHRLFPALSPGKTWEGAAAGAAAAAAAAALVGWIGGLPIGWWGGVGLGMGLGVLAQLGDLAESAMKRAAGVEESGSLLPGHGGLLDRLDSVVFILVALYHVVEWGMM